jgi:hypothetical protein
MTARPHDRSRTNRDGTRPDAASIPRGRPTLPPLPSLAEPIYVIGAAARTPERVREKELSDTAGRRESELSTVKRTARPPVKSKTLADLAADPREIAKLRRNARCPN